MSDQDRYIPGVPCWIDTTQPDPEAAVAFYGELFGWEFEDVMPPDAPRRYFIARLRGGDVAAVAPSPRARRPPRRGTPTSGSTTPTRPRPRSAPPAARVLAEPRTSATSGRMAVFADPEGARSASGRPGAPRRRGRQRARLAELQRPQHARRRAARRRSTARCSAGSCSTSATARVGAARLRRLPRAAHARACARAWPRWAPRRASRRWSRAVVPIADDQPDTPAHWGVTFGGRRRRRDRARARPSSAAACSSPPFDAPWVRMTVITDPQGATFTASKFVPENKDIQQSAGAAA